MPSAEIIAIGSELLLGETLDTNTRFLLQNFRTLGIDVYRTMIIGDNAVRISSVIRNAMERADIVITTGGLGPTVDDPTRSAAAMALDCDLEFKPELWEEICSYISRMNRKISLNNKRQAFIPSAAKAISNPVGTAPAFYAYRSGKMLVSLPGVPREMEYLFNNSVIPILKDYYHFSGMIVMHNLHSFGIGESAVDEIAGDLEKTANPSLGLCAKMGQIDLRITAKADTTEEAERLASEYEQILREKLGTAIFGKDEETLESAVRDLIRKHNIHLRILEINTGGLLTSIFDRESVAEIRSVATDEPQKEIDRFSCSVKDDVLDVILAIDSAKADFIRADVYILTDGISKRYTRSYNLLTVDERDWIQWTLNAIRLTLIERQLP